MDNKNQKGLKFSGPHQLLVHCDDVNILREKKIYIYTTKNTEVLLVLSKTVCVEVDAEKFNFVSYLCLVIRMQDKLQRKDSYCVR